MEEKNEKNEVNKNNKKLFILAFALIIIIAGSYAWLRLTVTSESVNTLRAGNLDLVLDDLTSNGILLSNTIPMSDKKGLETVAYTFTLENRGTIDSDYTIYLSDLPLDISEERMDDKYVKYSLTKNGGSAQTNLLPTIGTNPDRVLDQGRIPAKETNSYTLRLWIDGNADNKVMGTIFYGKIRVVATQTGIKTSQPKNENITATYAYDATSCVTGEESTCQVSTCTEKKDSNSCAPGTIIKYKVNDTEEKYFNVLHDNGTTMTLQQRENTVNNVRYSNNYNTTEGPTMILTALEDATTNWTNISTVNYTLGETTFLTNPYTGCSKTDFSCTVNAYTMAERNTKARMITVQELVALGCTGSAKSCPIWVYSYLASDGTYPQGYWTMSAIDNYIYDAWRIDSSGNVGTSAANYTSYGGRAVVEINK